MNIRWRIFKGDAPTQRQRFMLAAKRSGSAQQVVRGGNCTELCPCSGGGSATPLRATPNALAISCARRSPTRTGSTERPGSTAAFTRSATSSRTSWGAATRERPAARTAATAEPARVTPIAPAVRCAGRGMVASSAAGASVSVKTRSAPPIPKRGAPAPRGPRAETPAGASRSVRERFAVVI